MYHQLENIIICITRYTYLIFLKYKQFYIYREGETLKYLKRNSQPFIKRLLNKNIFCKLFLFCIQNILLIFSLRVPQCLLTLGYFYNSIHMSVCNNKY